MCRLNASHMHKRTFRSTKVLIFSEFFILVAHAPLPNIAIFNSDDPNNLKNVIFPSLPSTVSYDKNTKYECIYIERLIAISRHHSLCSNLIFTHEHA